MTNEAAQLNVLISGGFAGAYEQLLPEFQRMSGIKVTTGSGASQRSGPQTIAVQLGRSVAADVGDYYGYDGPCPPWNDALVHRYIFTLYALDVANLDTHDDLTGAGVETALAGHMLAEARLTGTYTLNPRAEQRSDDL